MQEGAPDFMRTGAWQQKQMQTQLTSWTELRHDTILHVKQSYSTGVICSNPHGYVEPVPELYRRVGVMAQFALEQVVPLVPPSELATRMAGFYTRVHELMQTLETIAEKELAHQALSVAEEEFLQGSYASSSISCGYDVENGWLAELYFDPEDEMPISAPDFIVADIHTQPTDESGAPVGHVLHVGTVHPRLGVFIAGCPTSEPIAFVGPVGSMRQFVSWDFERQRRRASTGTFDPGRVHDVAHRSRERTTTGPGAARHHLAAQLTKPVQPDHEHRFQAGGRSRGRRAGRDLRCPRFARQDAVARDVATEHVVPPLGRNG